ncbi:MAG: sodium/sugar symporter [Xanthomonadales bacterium]|nr:sodium/sugar symporter [Xanthomonadales bacterium]
MNSTLQTLDLVVLAIYVLVLVGIALWISRSRPGHERDAADYFLAGRSLPWWAIGASLIAANISAEQIIGMAGSGYVIGLAIASYEWTAAIALILVGKFLLPIFLAKGIYTMPQFLELRYDRSVKTVMATFWLGVYIFVNLTAVLWLGALAINTLTGLAMGWGMLFLGAFAVAYSLYGGLKAVAMTDIIQVVLLVLGGLLIAWLTLDRIAGDAGGPWTGLVMLATQMPDKFHMILDRGHPQYHNLPGLGVLLGGLWVMHMSYWGFNQYIIQRALAARSVAEAQKGIVFAAFLKLLMPLIIVVPGIAAAVLAPNLAAPDQAYPTMMALAPVGIRGLIFAALVAAIVSSLGSMMNSVSTIFTMDLYRQVMPGASQRQLVTVGRLAGLVAIVVAMLAARPLLGGFEQAFQYIQEFTGFFTPGICVLFLFGLFWKGATPLGALAAAIGSFVFSLAFRYGLPQMPFMDRVGYVFLLCAAVLVVVSLLQRRGADPRAIDCSAIGFTTTTGFNVASAVITAALIALYAWLW